MAINRFNSTTDLFPAPTDKEVHEFQKLVALSVGWLALVLFLFFLFFPWYAEAEEIPEDRLLVLMDFAERASGIPSNDEGLPLIVWVESERAMQTTFYGAEIVAEYDALPNVQLATVGAFYRPDSRTMYISSAVDYEDPYRVSIVVHELVHHLQTLNNMEEGLWCLQHLEPLAYEVQSLWLIANGLAPIDKFAIFNASHCFEE